MRGERRMQAQYNIAEQMIVSAAREIRDGDIIYAGVGMPNVAVLLAKFSHAPNATVFYETGIIRTDPCILGLGVDTLPTQYMSDKLTDVLYINSLAQRGFFTLGFLGGGQIDRHGNVNTNCTGPYSNPSLRFPGSGGGCDIASLCRNVIVVIDQKKYRFPERVDFVSGPGYLDGKPESRERAGLMPGTGPRKVVTNLGIYSFAEGEMVLDSIHSRAGVSLEDIRSNTGWDIKVSKELRETVPPTQEELRLLREKVDPDGKFIREKLVL
ncbi:MAG: 3-oxoadipate--succinyl-CoA transferase subunit B [Deltaproteobacteria bacterium HGW-Deltaproteobacteria-21]|nr:MAG: 3-oxoadipate--succinyl-CoA transferase subunit B [Deltaproteobacteria bacterium HGW-Deltaproteobacteria-21]